MLGLKHSPTPVTVLGLTQGTVALDITLLLITSCSTFSTIDVVRPVLAKSVLEVVICLVVSNLPDTVVCTAVLTTPLHWVSQAFQTVPNWLALAAVTESKFPPTFTIIAGATSVSNHSSPLGVKVILPTNS